MRERHWLMGLVVMLYSMQVTSAQITQLSCNSFVNGIVPNTVTNDLSIDFTGQYTGSQLLIQLTAGSIYQDSNGDATPPNGVLLGVFPSLEFDSFVALGSATSNGPFGSPSMGGGAVNLAGLPESQFETASIDQAWIPAFGQTNLSDQTDFLTARITLSDDAQGIWSLLASANGKFGVVESFQIENGSLLAPVSGDYDSSGTVAQADLDLALLNWGATSPPVPDGWINDQPTGVISQDELDTVLLNWGETGQSPWSIVPEQVDPYAGGTQTGLEGDFNGSGQVEQADLDLVSLNIGQPGTPPPPGWVNDFPDDVISCCDEGDRVLLNWGNTLPLGGSTQSVPEPTSLALICSAGFVFVGRFLWPSTAAVYLAGRDRRSAAE